HTTAGLCCYYIILLCIVLLTKDMGICDSLFGIFISVVGLVALARAIMIGKWENEINQKMA
ncbi:hypothetical protein COD67_15050, partial [Bacillus cereus]